MNHLGGCASASVAAPARDCLALLLDVESYPKWYPDVVRHAELVGGGEVRPSAAVTGAVAEMPVALARTTVHLGVGPLRRDFDLLLEISTDGTGIVRLTRLPNERADREELSLIWRIEKESSPERVRLSADLSARLEVPRLLPLHGLGDSVAQGFVSAARRALSRPVPER